MKTKDKLKLKTHIIQNYKYRTNAIKIKINCKDENKLKLNEEKCYF